MHNLKAAKSHPSECLKEVHDFQILYKWKALGPSLACRYGFRNLTLTLIWPGRSMGLFIASSTGVFLALFIYKNIIYQSFFLSFQKAYMTFLKIGGSIYIAHVHD